MTTRDCVLIVLVQLLLVTGLALQLATTDLDPCWPDCRARFTDA